MNGRVERIGDATLYLGDCREILPTLGRVDHVIGDPPYEAEAHSAQRRTQRSVKTGVAEVLDFDAISEELRGDVARFAATNCDGWALLFCQVEAVTAWRDALVGAGARYRRAMVWVKPDSSPQFTGDCPAQGYESIVAAWCADGRSRWNGGGRRGVFNHPVNVGRYGGHPTEKPLPLMREFVSLFTEPGQLILDPFLGSGTTGVAAVELDRSFVGVERDPKYFDLACRRIEEAYRQPRLFDAPAPKPVQGSLLDAAE